MIAVCAVCNHLHLGNNEMTVPGLHTYTYQLPVLHTADSSALSCLLLYTTGQLLCVFDVVVHSTSCTTASLSWKAPARGRPGSYRISVCPNGAPACPYHHTCSECSSYEVTGLLPYQNYTIVVETFGLSSGETSSSSGCPSNTVTTTTKVLCEFRACIVQH